MRFKRIAASALAVATMVGMAACGSGGDANADGKVEFTVWHNSTTGDGKKFWDDAAADYMKEHSNVTIKMEAIQNEDLDGKLQTALQDPDSAPDVFFARGGQKLQDIIDAGQVMDLTDKLSDTVKTQMATALKGETFDGRVYAVPQSVEPGGIWYSKDLFAKAGITETPTTWDEFVQVVQKLKDAGITPIALGAKDAWPAAHWWYWFALRECSSDTFDKSTKSMKFTDACWTRAGEDVQKLIDLDAFNKGFLTTPAQQGASSSAGLVANHMAAMELMGGWDPGVIRDLTPDKKDMADLGYFAFPTVDGGEGDPTAVMGGMNAMAVGAWAPEEAVDFLNFISEKDYQEKYAKAFSTIPASKDAQEVVENPALKESLAVYGKAKSMSLWLDTLFGQNVGNALNEGVVNMMAGKGSAEDIIKGVESAAAKG
ncbi:extracellular solute-binding protein [Bifidobacterium pullorum subsp. saeculare]|uniref:Extracellular solute-binding protein n=1 Tax=Bifidobacterium pullorum subsp. saeculare TaxID=78257 RepID=A0A939B9Z0_9BIFI|nr:extracellular solute-binding protein [Bifidobacterium pullorum]MBM6699979.1 extracellular solute-binding protein [Bifidobacterium pullorum subsp. saeculare]